MDTWKNEFKAFYCSCPGFKKIQGLARTDLNKKYDNEFLQDDDDFEIVDNYNIVDEFIGLNQ